MHPQDMDISRFEELTRHAFRATTPDSSHASYDTIGKKWFPSLWAIIVCIGIIGGLCVSVGICTSATHASSGRPVGQTSHKKTTQSSPLTHSSSHRSDTQTPVGKRAEENISEKRKSKKSDTQLGTTGCTDKTVYVHVVGEVATPGVATLCQGARVIDAIKQSGGFTANARQDATNIARLVNDGEQIRIYGQNEEIPDQAYGTSQDAQSSQSPSSSHNQGRININTASEDELQQLDGIGPALAHRIVEDREKQGRFSSVEDIDRVSGIGKALIRKLDGKITV